METLIEFVWAIPMILSLGRAEQVLCNIFQSLFWSIEKHWGLQESDAKEAAVPHEAQARPVSIQHQVVFWLDVEFRWILLHIDVPLEYIGYIWNHLDTMVQGRRPNWQRSTSSNRDSASIKDERIRGYQRIKMDYASLWQCNDHHAALLQIFWNILGLRRRSGLKSV